MNLYTWSAIGLGVLVLLAIGLSRCLRDDVTEADVQRQLNDLDPHGIKRSFERQETK